MQQFTGTSENVSRRRLDAAAPRPAFTLIELLMVISIIGLLVALLLPALAGARDAAKATRCLSNIRQVAQATASFSADHKGELPENRRDVSDAGGPKHVTWRYTLVEGGYLPRGEVWACPLPAPAGATGEEGEFDFGSGSVCVGDVPSNYAVNGHILWRGELSDDESERRVFTVPRASHTILFSETQTHYPDIRVVELILGTQLPDDVGGWFGYWHDLQGTYAFADGHAELSSLLDTGNPDCRWHNGRDNDLDPFEGQEAGTDKPHAHPEWKFIVDEIYR